MLKRVHIRGFKSLADVEEQLEPLTVLFGPNASGKSSFLDALQLLSKLGTSRTLRDAFDYPYRGKPLDSFPLGKQGVKGLIEQERLALSIEADLRLSDAVVSQAAARRPEGTRGRCEGGRGARQGSRTSSAPPRGSRQ